MKDLKEHLILNKEKLLESLQDPSKLGALNEVSGDLNYWNELFTFSSDRKALENFLLYRTASAFTLFKPHANDADMVEPALCELKSRLESIPSVASVAVGKEIYKEDKERAFFVTLKNGTSFFLESDTATSLMKDLGDFLRNILRSSFGSNWPEATYIKQYGLEKGKSYNYYKPFRNYYFFTLISKLYNEPKDSLAQSCLYELERRAQLTHKIPNIILVPYGYNAPRGTCLTTYKTKVKISDRLDLTMLDFEEMIDSPDFTDQHFQERLKNKKCTIASIEFLLEHRDILFPKIPIFDKTLEGSNTQSILNRSKAINKILTE